MGDGFRELKNMAGGLMLCRKYQAGFSHLTALARGWKRLRHQPSGRDPLPPSPAGTATMCHATGEGREPQ